MSPTHAEHPPPYEPSRAERLQGRFLRFVLSLPTPVVRRLAGRPVRVDGQTLAPEMQLMLRLQRLVREPVVESLPMAAGREAMVRQAAMVGGDQPVAAVRDLRVDGQSGPLRARLYTPREQLAAERAPTLLFLHGGGMTYGDLDSHDAAARFLAHRSGVQVLAVDYRLAPEAPYPGGVEDSIAAYRWLVAHAADVGADPDRLAVGGDSAGGYLSATTAVLAAQEGLPMAFQLLIYPVTDFTQRTRSRELFNAGFFLTEEFMEQCTAAYFGGEDAETDKSGPLGSVLRRTEWPERIAPAYVVTAGFDPLRDEGEAYARLLAEQGVEVEHTRYPSMIHGFFNMVGAGREAPAYDAEIAARLRAALIG